MEYGSSGEEEIECKGDEASEEYVWSNTNGSGEEKEVRRRTRVVKELAEQAEQRVLQWFGHVERMEENRLVKKVTRSDVRGVRPRGRPRMGWLDSVKSALGARGMSVEQGRGLMHDRNEWRASVNE